jgi:hypothetical protein
MNLDVCNFGATSVNASKSCRHIAHASDIQILTAESLASRSHRRGESIEQEPPSNHNYVNVVPAFGHFNTPDQLPELAAHRRDSAHARPDRCADERRLWRFSGMRPS